MAHANADTLRHTPAAGVSTKSGQPALDMGLAAKLAQETLRKSVTQGTIPEAHHLPCPDLRDRRLP